MSLFKIPERNINIQEILKKASTEEKPKIKIKGQGNTLLTKLEIIAKTVKEKLGKEQDNYLCITDENDFIKYCRNCVKDGVVAIDTETNGLDSIKTSLVGVCLYSPSQKPAYVPVGHISAITEKKADNQISIETLRNGLNIINESKTRQIYHNSYFDKLVIYENTGIWVNVHDDTLLMGWYLNENEAHGLKYLYDKYVANGKAGVHTFSDLFDGIPFCYVPYLVGYIYGANDAYMTYKLWEFFIQYLDRRSPLCKECNLQRASDVYRNVEIPLLDVLARMKRKGIKFDFDKAKELKEKYIGLKKEAEKEFHKSIEPYKKEIEQRKIMRGDIEYPINYNSPQQMKILIYDIIKAGVIYKKEPTGTGKHVMEEIISNKKYKGTQLFVIAQALQEVKKYDKLIGGFIEKLSEDAKNHEGRIHCNFNQCGATSLRMSSSEPNLQQVPSKNDDIRNMFIADENSVLCNLDFSQQEMMAVSCLADDDKMLEAFHLGRDIYSHVASIAFKVPYEDCLEFNADGTTNKEGKIRRKKSKAICLGGQTPHIVEIL